MQFPDPPLLEKGALSDDEIVHRAAQLYRAGLLKADWDPAQHPRTGTKPNPGWFAPKPKTSVPSVKPRTGWPQPDVNKAVRALAKGLLSVIEESGTKPWVSGVILEVMLDLLLKVLTPEELNQGEDRLTAQLKAAMQGPKTLEELQQPPTENALGYEQHHIVNQNSDNLQKGVVLAKFGGDAIDDPSNIVWIPRLLHECVNSKYSENSDGPGSPTVRDVINQMDFNQQYQKGLEILRECGVLK